MTTPFLLLLPFCIKISSIVLKHMESNPQFIKHLHVLIRCIWGFFSIWARSRQERYGLPSQCPDLPDLRDGTAYVDALVILIKIRQLPQEHHNTSFAGIVQCPLTMPNSLPQLLNVLNMAI